VALTVIYVPSSLDCGNRLFFHELAFCSAAERGGNTFNGFKDFRIENGSSQGQLLALSYSLRIHWTAV
jgi:hypothetical protein